VDLSEMQAKIREMARLPELAAPDVADALVKQIRKDLEKGVAPGGDVWPERAIGGRALQNAGEFIQPDVVVTSRSAVVYARVVSRHHILHHMGRANGAPERRMLPEEMTPEIAAAVLAALQAKFDEVSRG
jgi:hypothetical protein